MQVDDNELVVLASPGSGAASLLVYSLASPSSPTLLGQTPLTFQSNAYQYLIGFSISNNHVYTSSFWYQYTHRHQPDLQPVRREPRRRHQQPGGARRRRASSTTARPIPSTGFPDGTTNIWQTAAVNDQTLLIGSTTASGANVNGPGVNGVVLVVDTTNPAAPVVTETLTIPGMAVVTGISVQGNKAFVIGSSQNWKDGVSGLGGNVVVAMLDLTNPAEPDRHLDPDAECRLDRDRLPHQPGEQPLRHQQPRRPPERVPRSCCSTPAIPAMWPSRK